MGTQIADARRLALALPEATESAHFSSPDFRVGNKIFASLHRGDSLVVKLTPEQQAIMTDAEPAIFTPVKGGWGNQGWTRVVLEETDELTLKSALTSAWRNVAPKRLVAAFDKGS
jgi:hypothetical protein